jgi:hypothetical protein
MRSSRYGSCGYFPRPAGCDSSSALAMRQQRHRQRRSKLRASSSEGRGWTSISSSKSVGNGAGKATVPPSRVAFLMPGVEAALRAPKPEFGAEQGDALGAQLRRRRRELGHRRIDAAQVIGTSCKSIMWWEHNERQPLDRSWPAIIAYLGREPWPEPRTLGARLLAERRRRGLFIFEAA